jgi:hypothetical protein
MTSANAIMIGIVAIISGGAKQGFTIVACLGFKLAQSRQVINYILVDT